MHKDTIIFKIVFLKYIAGLNSIYKQIVNINFNFAFSFYA